MSQSALRKIFDEIDEYPVSSLEQRYRNIAEAALDQLDEMAGIIRLAKQEIRYAITQTSSSAHLDELHELDMSIESAMRKYYGKEKPPGEGG